MIVPVLQQPSVLYWRVTYFYFLPPCLIVFDFMVYHGPNFLISKTKKRLIFFLRLEARHLQEIHWYGNFCWMYGLALIVSIPTLNTCQILMRFMRLLMVTEAWNPALRAKSWIQLLWPKQSRLAIIKSHS